MNEAEILKDLNKEQAAAVTHKNGPLLIVAGAGTGKTTVITRRIAWLIAKKLAKPSEILALTFTEKAAGEMEERVDRLLPYGFTDVNIMTFHAFGDLLIRKYSLDLGLNSNLRVLSKTQQAIFIHQNLFSFDLKHYRPISNPTAHILKLISFFSNLKDELISTDKYLKFASKQLAGCDNTDSDAIIEAEKQLELAKAYQHYNRLLTDNSMIDYGDQLFITYTLLKTHPSVLKEVRSKYKYILVDEFQDTNFAQNEILKTIAGKSGNLNVVGDDDQSIYRFRGASIFNILKFKEDYPKSHQVILIRNYRSTIEILNGAYNLIQNNNPDRLEVINHFDKHLMGQRHGSLPELIYGTTLNSSVDLVVSKIKSLIKHNIKPKDIVILARANDHLKPYIAALRAKNIPVSAPNESSLFSQPEILNLISFFRLLVNPNDNLSLFRLATSDLYNYPIHLMSDVYYNAQKNNRPIIERLNHKIFETILFDLQKYRQKIYLQPGELLYDFLKDKKYLQTLAQDRSAKSENKIRTISRFFERLAEFQKSGAKYSLIDFLENLELIIDYADVPLNEEFDPNQDSISALTVHAAKGLEWPVVFIVDLVNGRFPSTNKNQGIKIPDKLLNEKLPDADFHLMEERRLFYVAITRAMDQLFLVAASDYGGQRPKKISQFVPEFLDQANLKLMSRIQSSPDKFTRFEVAPDDASNIKIIAPRNLSRQQIDDYLTCPKKYYYSSVLRIPLPINWHFSYGSAIHTAISNHFQRRMRGKKISLETLISDFKGAFSSEGYLSREHEDLRKKQGIQSLERFFAEESKLKLNIKSVEESFKMTVLGKIITGRYDLVTTKNESTVIIDFKTSKVTKQVEADKRIRQSTQMMIYALSYFKQHGTIPFTALYFIESDLKGEHLFSYNDLIETEKLMVESIKGINKSIFLAKATFINCRTCPYRGICNDAK